MRGSALAVCVGVALGYNATVPWDTWYWTAGSVSLEGSHVTHPIG